MTAPHIAFNLWDWDPAWNDLGQFAAVCDQLRALGVDALETTVPWSLTQPSPGTVDPSPIQERIAIVRDRGLDLRLRLNFQDPPEWFSPVWSQDDTGAPFVKGYGRQPLLPSLFDDRTLHAWETWAGDLAAALAPDAPLYSLGMGLHFELKYGEWVGYERHPQAPPAARAESAPLAPDVLAWVALREHRLRTVVDRLAAAVRAGDGGAALSAPLGEGFRHQAARFSNQDITGLSRHADEVVYSHDFFIHGPGAEWQLETSVAIYASATSLPVHVEIDGAGTGVYQRFGDEGLLRAAEAALRGGAVGFNVANFTTHRDWTDDLAQFSFIRRLTELELAAPGDAPVVGVVLSPWSYYASRDASESLHAEHYGLVDALRRGGHAVSIVSESAHLPALPDGAPLLIPSSTVVTHELRQALDDLSDTRVLSVGPGGSRALDAERRVVDWSGHRAALVGDYTRLNNGPVPPAIEVGALEGPA